LAWLEWLGMEEAGFDLTGIAWNGRKIEEKHAQKPKFKKGR
jgi:hypothetical protein